MKHSKTKFYDKIINDFSDASYFVSIKSYNEDSYIIENNNLYNYLKKQRSIDKEHYKKEIKEKLINGSSFEINNANSNFIKVPTLQIIESNANKGVEEFIKTYFNNSKTLKYGISNDERAAIILKLFEWEVASRIDDESGYLVISR